MFKKILKFFMIFFSVILVLFLLLVFTMPRDKEHFLLKSSSPNHQYEVKGYKGIAPSTIPNYVFVDLYTTKNTEKIQETFYFEEHVQTLEVKWIDNTHVKINGHKLNVKDLKEHDFSDYGQ
jgi:hypothetical protein